MSSSGHSVRCAKESALHSNIQYQESPSGICRFPVPSFPFDMCCCCTLASLCSHDRPWTVIDNYHRDRQNGRGRRRKLCQRHQSTDRGMSTSTHFPQEISKIPLWGNSWVSRRLRLYSRSRGEQSCDRTKRVNGTEAPWGLTSKWYGISCGKADGDSHFKQTICSSHQS